MSEPVIIIGAGVAGLYASQLLRSHGVDSVVVEASDYVGGRVKQVTGFVPWSVDIGGEYVHGDSSLLYDLAARRNWHPTYLFDISSHVTPGIRYEPNRTLIWLALERALKPFHCDDVDVRHFHDVVQRLGEHGCEREQTMMQYLVEQGVAWRVLSLADSVLAKTYATSLDKLSAKAWADEGAAGTNGSANYRLRESFAPLLHELAAGVRVLLDWQVKQVVHDASGVAVVNKRGETLRGAAVLVTVPLSVLKDNDIQFTPPLPADKRAALDGLGMSHGMKVILRVKKQVWPAGTTLVLCGDSFASQVWFDGFDVRGTNTGTVVGFLVGPEAEHVAKLPETEIVRRLTAQIDEMFGNAANPTPCSDALDGHLIHSWSTQPYIRGAYSYPLAAGARVGLAKPVSARLHFAGEATTEDCPATIHGAMGSAQRAVTQILQMGAVVPPKAKL